MWYYAIGDAQQGPVSSDQLDALIADGIVTRETLVWNESLGDWKPAHQIPGLLPAGPPGVPPAAPNYAASPQVNPYSPSQQANPYAATTVQQRKSHPDGAAVILVLGILGLVTCAPLGTLAWVMGNTYMEGCRSRQIEPEGIAVAGRICGIIATAFIALGIMAVMLMLVLG